MIYFSPEECGLSVVCEVDRSNESYSFDSMCVWKDKDGYLFYAEDSGCSCPAPYENETIETIIKIDNIDDFERHFKIWFSEGCGAIELDGFNFMKTVKDNFTK